jgi:hypothetical protein
MQATVGDRLVVHGHKVGETGREGEILQVLGPGGAPPYLVRWTDGQERVFFPSSDADIRTVK